MATMNMGRTAYASERMLSTVPIELEDGQVFNQSGRSYSGVINSTPMGKDIEMTAYDNWPEGFTKGPQAFSGAVYDGENIWMIPYRADRIIRFEPQTGQMTGYNAWPEGYDPGPDSFANGAFHGGVFDGKSIWLIPFDANMVVQLNPETGEMRGYNTWPEGVNTADYKFSGGYFDGESIILVPEKAEALVELNPTTGEMKGYSGWPEGLRRGANRLAFESSVFDGKNVWMLPYEANQVVKFNTVTKEMTGYDDAPEGVNLNTTTFIGGAYDGKRIWMAPLTTEYVIAIDSSTGQMSKYEIWPEGVQPFPSSYNSMFYDGKAVWLIPYNENAFMRIDPNTGEATLHGNWPEGFNKGLSSFFTSVSDGEYVWAIPFSADQIIRISGSERPSPPAPGNLQAISGDGEVTLTWSEVESALYSVYRYEGNGAPEDLNDWQKVAEGVSAATYTVSGLTNGVDYTFAVTAIIDGVESDFSAAVTVKPQASPKPDTEAPQWPEGSELTVSDVGQTKVKLSWPSATDNAGVAGYRIYVDGIERETVGSDVNDVTIAGLTADTRYRFKVTAYDEAGNESEPGLIAEATTLPEPTDPDSEAPEWPEGSELTVSEITQTSMKLSWPSATDNVGVTGYRIYVDGINRETVGGDVNEAIVEGLSADTTYTFKVTAYDEAGNESAVGLTKTASTRSRPSSGGNDSGGSSGGGWYLSSNTNLKALEIWTAGKRVSLTPSFSANIYAYKAETEAKQIEVKVIADHAASKVTWHGKALGDGIQIDLQEGANIIPLIVQAEDGSRETYTLSIDLVTPKPEEPEPPMISFTDIAGHWAEIDIKHAAAKGIVSGNPNGAFKPNNPVTRAEFTVMLAGALKLEEPGAALTFTDQNQIGAWAKQAVAQAVQLGIVNGYTDGSFRPNAHITRSEMAVMIARALKLQINAKAPTGFADDEAIPQWARGAAGAIRELGIVDGRGQNRFVPNETAVRAEATVMLLRMHSLR
ncbi:S-layer homology domain-containing protein [Paenibacillus sp. GCM10027626]|uniref:S-layer homology domain-containing protein n=1 Tax=Paenibacillus sp. GCM10027626 TaxID=3273411 RepID=UPI003634F43F